MSIKPTYPVIIYPRIIVEFILNNFPSEANKITTTDQQVLKKVVKHRQNNNNTFNFIALTLASILGVRLIYYIYNQLENWLLIGAIALVILGSWALLGAATFTNSKKQERKIKIPAKKVKSKKLSPEFNRQKKLAAMLQGVVLEPKGISNAQQGVSEAQFFRELKRFFPYVQQGVTFQINGFNHPYSADFILRHPTGLSIDIEIDEPYVGNTGQPHHAVNQGKDDIRNNFFVEHNWIVVRFSEEQVVRYPERCCKAIAFILNQVCGDDSALIDFKNTPELPKMARWTVKEAKKMAKQNYRQTYLNY